MTRAFALLAIAACSSSGPTPSPPAKIAAGFSREVSALANVEALDYLPASMTAAVFVASSLDDVDARLGPALGMFEDLTGLAPAGISHTRPVGVAQIGYDSAHWIAFADVDDAKPFEASVPEERRVRRGKLGFVADSEATLEIVTSNPYRLSIARDAGFRARIEALQLGALVSWWDNGRATGIAFADGRVRVRTVGEDRGLVHYPDLREEPEPVRVAHFMRGTAPRDLVAERDAVHADYAAMIKEINSERSNTVRELVLELDIPQPAVLERAGPYERTFAMPGGDSKHWLAHRFERFRATALARAARALHPRLVALEERVDRALDASAGVAEAKLMARLTETPRQERGAGSMTPEEFADAMTADRRELGQVPQHETPGTPKSVGEVPHETPGRGGGGRRGVGGGPHQPTVAISDPGNAALYAHLHGRLARVRACYERALERDPKLGVTLTLALSADGAGAVTARASGKDKSLASCIEIAARGTSGAKSESASFAVRLEP